MDRTVFWVYLDGGGYAKPRLLKTQTESTSTCQKIYPDLSHAMRLNPGTLHY